MRWFTLILIGCVSVQATAADINVPADHATIRAAIVAANPDDVVIVAPGTYLGVINFLGKAITVRSTDPNDPAVVVSTIIDGIGLSSVVTCSSGEGPGSVLSGFVITGGSGIGGGAGGGMYNAGSSPTVTNCLFIGNSVALGFYTFGGGMYNSSSSPTVTNCSFTDNTVFAIIDALGGGMYNGFGSSPTVTNCSFRGNTVSSDGEETALARGGGMYNDASSSPTVTNTVFCSNSPDAVFGTYTDGGGNLLTTYCPPPIPVPSSCPADINTDTNVNVTDLLALLAAWGACP